MMWHGESNPFKLSSFLTFSDDLVKCNLMVCSLRVSGLPMRRSIDGGGLSFTRQAVQACKWCCYARSGPSFLYVRQG